MAHLEKPVTVVQRSCSTCDGTGAIDIPPYCRLCQTLLALDDPWWETGENIMPCGHDADFYLVEDKPCPTCAGTGVYDHILTPEEQRARQRQRVMRATFIVLLILVGLGAVIAVVLQDDPPRLCGFWWYGVLGVWLLERMV